MAGRNPFKPTDEQKKSVRTMAGMGVPQDFICQLVYNSKGNPITGKTLRRHFRKELDQGIAAGKVRIFQTAHAVATDKNHPGCVAMNIWTQKTQCGMKEGQTLELTGKDGADLYPATPRVVYVDPPNYDDDE